MTKLVEEKKAIKALYDTLHQIENLSGAKFYIHSNLSRYMYMMSTSGLIITQGHDVATLHGRMIDILNSYQMTASTIRKVSDIPESYTLVQDSQDITATLESIGRLDIYHEAGCLFVEVLEGDYGHVFYASGTIPYLTNNVYRIQ